MAQDQVQVHMLGKFSVSYAGETVDLRFGASTKVMQIFQILLYHAPKSVKTTSLLNDLFEYDDVLSPRNNLKVSISQLRRRLSESALPGESCIRFADGGYSLDCGVPIWLDVHEFEALANQGAAEQDEDKKAALYRQALELYTGDFLPDLVGIDWASKLNAYYWNLCSDVVRALSRILMSRQDYEGAYEILDRAFQQHHAEEWQILKIECVMKLGQWERAKEIYQETVTTLDKEFAVAPSQTLLDQYEAISKQTQNEFSTLDEMMDSVREKEPVGGAYYCAFPGFIDSCRIISRNMARSGISCYLMMLSLGDRNGSPVTNPERLKEASGRLFQAIQNSLRRGDSFTQYNSSQFLVFLFGTNQDNCSLVFDRIRRNYAMNSVYGVQVFSQVTSCAMDMERELNFNGGAQWTPI